MVEHRSLRPPTPRHSSRGARRGRAAVGVALASAAIAGLLVATPLVGGSPKAAAAPSGHTGTLSAYWLVAADGGVFSFGGTPFYGSMGGHPLNRPIVGMAGAAGGAGYWLVASDGGIFAFGRAGFYGSTGSLVLNRPVVGMAALPDGSGYWLVASDGGIFAFGHAGFYGSMGGKVLNRPVVGMAPTPDGKGYWLVAADGGIFAFGDAGFFGSTGSLTLNRPIVGMTASPSGHGYWFTASDGGVFAFGDAGFFGSLGSVPLSRPVVAMASTADGKGYWFANNNGGVTAYGDATYWGSTPQVLAQPVVGMAQAPGNDHFAASPYPSGSFGYDVSGFQCGGFPPPPHTIGIVQVVGESMGPINPCLAGEAGWAGAGLNLYIFLTFGTSGTDADPACNSTAAPPACQYGFLTAKDAYTKALQAGVNTSVAWWLDVESYSLPGIPSWQADPNQNASLVQGALDGLRSSEGLNNVGIYASPGVWNGIVGGYQPAVAYWAASWGVDPASTCGSVRSQFPTRAVAVGAGPDRPVQLALDPAAARRDGHRLRQRLRLLSRRAHSCRPYTRAHQVGGVVVAEQPPPAGVDLPAGERSVRGPQLQACALEPAVDGDLRQQGRLDHPGVGRGDHQLAGVASRQLVERGRDPAHEPGPALASRCDRPRRIGVPVGAAEGGGEFLPGEPVRLAGMQLAECALGDEGGHDPGRVRETGRDAVGGLDRPREHARIEGRRTGQFAGGAQPCAEGRHLGPSGIGQASAAEGPATHSRYVADRLAVADEHQPCRLGRLGRDRAHAFRRVSTRRPRCRPRQPVEPGSGAAHVSSPTNCSSWRSVRHSTTVVAVPGVLADDRVPRVPVGLRLGVEPVDVAARAWSSLTTQACGAWYCCARRRAAARSPSGSSPRPIAPRTPSARGRNPSARRPR